MKTAIVDFSEIRSNSIWRLEAEFYSQKSRMGSNFVLGEDAIDFVQYGTSEELNENNEGYPVLRLNEYDGLFIKTPAKYCDKINAETYRDLCLKKNDILICRTNGNPKLVGKSAIVPKDYDYAFASYLFRIRPKEKVINSATLVIYLNGKIGRSQIEKNLMVSNQANFSPAKFREIQIPLISSRLQSGIEKIVFLVYKNQESANVIYKEAEQILLSELNLLDWKPKHKISFIKKFSDTESTSRIDAEYYQPKYEEIVAKVKSYKNGYKPLGEIIRIKDNNFTPKDDASYKYIELANISANGNINGFIEAKGKELPTRARRRVNPGDVIVSSIEGALSSIALVTDDLDNALCSTGFFVIDSDKINSETLLVLLKSSVGQLQLKKGCSGTILTAIGNEEFKLIILPEISTSVQKQLKLKIAEMYNSKALSKHLLEIAKRSVEIAIEKSEKEAESWINIELKKLNISL